jgi:hypothetical protein
MTDSSETPPPSTPKYRHCDIVEVMREIKAHMHLCSRAWIGLGEGRFLVLKDDAKGLSTYYVYEEGYFTFYDRRGGSQKVHIEEITEIAGY